MNLYLQARAVVPESLIHGEMTGLPIAVSVARADGPMNSLKASANYTVKLVLGPPAVTLDKGIGPGQQTQAPPPTQFSVKVKKHDVDGVYVITATPASPWLAGSYVLALHAAITGAKGTQFSGSTLIAFDVRL